MKKKRKVKREEVWSIYAYWYKSVFNKNVCDTLYNSKTLGNIFLSQGLLAFFELIHEENNDDYTFGGYLEFVHKCWSESKGVKSLLDLPGWLLSSRMLDRYLNSIEVKENGYKKTISDHGERTNTENNSFSASFCTEHRK